MRAKGSRFPKSCASPDTEYGVKDGGQRGPQWSLLLHARRMFGATPYMAVAPPSTRMLVPVTNRAAGEAR